ncbi:mechanosensitive ion channel family protein [Candidatus Sumerlaeota bacterium]|nr:mechanosensitive ion channel family protein [Candidatus Sumerlaeota bacterium]
MRIWTWLWPLALTLTLITVAAPVAAPVGTQEESTEGDTAPETRVTAIDRVLDTVSASAEAMVEQTSGEVEFEQAVAQLLASEEVLGRIVTGEEASVVSTVIQERGIENLAEAEAIGREAARAESEREIRTQVREREEAQANRAVAAFYSWLSDQMVVLGLGLLVYIVLIFATQRIVRRIRRRATEIRRTIDPKLDARLAEAEEALTGNDEKQEELARERIERVKQESAIEREARRVEMGAELFYTVANWVLLIALLAFSIAVIVINGGLPHIQNLMTGRVIAVVLGRLARIILILLAVNLIRIIIRAISNRVMTMVSDDDPDTMTEAEMRAQTLINVINGTSTVVLYVMAIIMILQQLSIPVGPLLAGAGIVGLAVGFGSQALVRDFISGFFVLMENQYRVGDVVKIAGIGGLVERITMRATYLRDLSGSVHVIPNGQIDTVTNMTYQWSRHVADIGVSYSADPDQVMDILHRVGAEMRKEEPWGQKMLDDPEVLGLDQFADSALVFKVLLKTKPLQQWSTGREYKRRLFYAFQKAGIEIPYPHRTTYLRMEGNENLNVLTGQPQDAAVAPPSLRLHIPGRHVPPAVAEEAGGSDLPENR